MVNLAKLELTLSVDNMDEGSVCLDWASELS